MQHLPSKIDILSFNLDEINPDIVALIEHKMTDEEVSLLNLEGYNVFSSFCRSQKLWGRWSYFGKEECYLKKSKYASIKYPINAVIILNMQLFWQGGVLYLKK